MTATWSTDHVKLVSTDPLNCIVDTDVANFTLLINALPSGYSITATPRSSGYTSTATVSSNSIAFTIPSAITTETWDVVVDPPGAATDSICVKLRRTVPG